MKDIKEAESETKAEDEDYVQIDLKFNAKWAKIEEGTDKWQETVKDKNDKEEVGAHFDGVFETYKELREYVNNYTFAIPSALFSQYQAKLNEFPHHFNRVKTEALPKKKFAFAKKGQNMKAKKDEAEEVVKQTVDQKFMNEGIHLSIKDLKGEARVL
jgi:hypothetical protein